MTMTRDTFLGQETYYRQKFRIVLVRLVKIIK